MNSYLRYLKYRKEEQLLNYQKEEQAKRLATTLLDEEALPSEEEEVPEEEEMFSEEVSSQEEEGDVWMGESCFATGLTKFQLRFSVALIEGQCKVIDHDLCQLITVQDFVNFHAYEFGGDSAKVLEFLHNPSTTHYERVLDATLCPYPLVDMELSLCLRKTERFLSLFKSVVCNNQEELGWDYLIHWLALTVQQRLKPDKREMPCVVFVIKEDNNALVQSVLSCFHTIGSLFGPKFEYVRCGRGIKPKAQFTLMMLAEECENEAFLLPPCPTVAVMTLNEAARLATQKEPVVNAVFCRFEDCKIVLKDWESEILQDHERRVALLAYLTLHVDVTAFDPSSTYLKT